MALPKLKLTYFPIAERAELTRLVLHYGGIPFTDERIGGYKFMQLRPKLPLGQIPVIEVDGEVFSQSMAIARYAAKLAGLYPTDPVEALRVDMISETLVELDEPLMAIRLRERDYGVRAAIIKMFLEETLPKSFNTLEKMVQGKFFLGDKPTYADFHAFDFVTNKLIPTFATLSLNAYPKLSAVVANVKALPNVAAYLAMYG